MILDKGSCQIFLPMSSSLFWYHCHSLSNKYYDSVKELSISYSSILRFKSPSKYNAKRWLYQPNQFLLQISSSLKTHWNNNMLSYINMQKWKKTNIKLKKIETGKISGMNLCIFFCYSFVSWFIQQSTGAKNQIYKRRCGENFGQLSKKLNNWVPEALLHI